MAEYSKKNEPGMDDTQAQVDRGGWSTTVAMVTGTQPTVHFCDGAGQEVGNQYDYDPMGEEYSAVTFGKNEPDYPGSSAGPAPNASMPEKSSGGGTVATRPQTMTTYGKSGA